MNAAVPTDGPLVQCLVLTDALDTKQMIVSPETPHDQTAWPRQPALQADTAERSGLVANEVQTNFN